MPIVPGGGDRWAGRRALEAVIAQSLAADLSDDDVRKALGKDFDFVVSDAARLLVASRKAGRVYDLIFETIKVQALAGEKVYLSGLGVFGLSESEGVLAGAVHPVGVNSGPLVAGWELRKETREAVLICGDNKAGAGAAWSFGSEWLSWSLGEFLIIDAPYLPTWGAAAGEGLITFFRIKSQLIRVSSPLRGASYFRSVGGFLAVVKGCFHVVGGRSYLEILSGDSSELKAAANAFYGYDYAGSAAGAWLAGAAERVGVDAESMPDAAAYSSEDLPGMSAAWMLKAYPREVVMMGMEGSAAGHLSWGPVEWLSGDEFRERFRWSRDSLIAQGYDWPELPIKRNKNKRMVCRFDDAFKSEVGLSVIE